MLRIDYPPHPFKIKEENKKHLIFDEVRKLWVILTPEEWVRQNFIQYLVQVKKYPSSVIAIEKEIRLGELKKRCDIVVYKSHQPWMIIECKEQTVSLNDAVIQQVLRYNISLKVKILVVTNGENTYATQLNNNGLIPLDTLPDWNEGSVPPDWSGQALKET
jgi:hypothetical protein